MSEQQIMIQLRQEKIKRVFFHELGYLVAHMVNSKYYQGLGVDHIRIYPCKGNPNDFCGHP